MSRKNEKTMPKRRNALAFLARAHFRAASFDHKTAERGGDTNKMADYMEEAFNDSIEDNTNDHPDWD
jgi:hypothetical protein